MDESLYQRPDDLPAPTLTEQELLVLKQHMFDQNLNKNKLGTGQALPIPPNTDKLSPRPIPPPDEEDINKFRSWNSGFRQASDSDWVDVTTTSEDKWEDVTPTEEWKTVAGTDKPVAWKPDIIPDTQFFKDVGNRLIGTGIDITEFFGALGPMLASYGVATQEGLKNLDKTREERRTIAGKAMTEYRQGATVREQYPTAKDFPTNPAIEVPLEKIGEGVRAVTKQFFGDVEDPRRTAVEDAIFLGMFGAGFKGLKTLKEAGKKAKPEVKSVDADAAAKLKEDLTKPAEEVLPEIKPEFRDETWTDIDASQTRFMDAMKPEETGSGKLPEKPLSDLETPNPEIPAKEVPYPKIEGEVPNADAAVEAASYIPKTPEERVPYQEPQGQVPFDPIPKPRIKAKVPETVDLGDVTPQEHKTIVAQEQLYGLVAHKPKVVSEIYRTTNARELVNVLNQYVPEHLRTIWEKVTTGLPEDVAVKIRDRGDTLSTAAEREMQKSSVHALAGYDEGGRQYIALQGLSNGLTKGGLSVETVAHELYHVRTKNAIRVGEDPILSRLPEYKPHKEFAAKAREIYQVVLDKLDVTTQDLYRSELSNLDEFITWGSTDLTFKKLLSEIKMGPVTAWQKLVRAVADFLGFKGKEELTALETLMDLSNKFEDITVSNATMRQFWERKAGARVKELTGMEKEEPKLDKLNMPEQVVKDLYSISSGTELLDYLKTETIGDLGHAIIKDTPLLRGVVDMINQNFTTTNQMRRILQHPVLTWTLLHIPKIHRQAEVRISGYKDSLSNVIKLDRKSQLAMFKGLVDVNDPKLLAERVQAVASGTEAQLLAKVGMAPELIPHALKVLDVMKDVYLGDQISAGRLGRGLPEAPMYFPRSHGGTFKFQITGKDANGKEVVHYVKGFKGAMEAQKYQNDMVKVFKDNQNGITVSPVERVDVPGFIDSIGDMMMVDSLPDYLKNQVKDLEASIETAKRKFELERSSRKVGGFIGEILHEDAPLSFGYFENNRLLDLLNNRIDDSYRFEVQSRILNEIVQPLMWAPEAMAGRPRLASAMNHLVLKEMGHDVAWTRKFDNALQRQADDVGLYVNKAVTSFLQLEASPVSAFSPSAVRQLAQNTVWITSAWKLGWNVPVLAVNTLTIPMVALDGIRTAFKEGKNPIIANYAYIKSMTAPWDKGALEFMEQARREGMTEARAADLFTITESHGAQGLKKNVDGVINSARNGIEHATNFMTILYYYNYYKLTRPDLNPLSEGFKGRVYNAARSWTGDYRELSTPQSISKMGVVGRLSSNFSKWMMNQTGRLLDDVSTIRNDPIKLQAYLPLFANMATIILLGGMYGAPVVAEYEYLRKIGQQLGAWDWKPFSGFYTEAQAFLKDKTNHNPLPDWMRRGMFTEINEAVTSAVTGGEESGLDISGSLRHAPVIQANLVAVQTFFDIFMSANKALKFAWTSAGKGSGWTEQDTKDSIKGLPSVLQPIMKDQLKVRRGDKYITQFANKEEGEYAQSEYERRLELAGFRTKRQNTASDLRQYQQWLERNAKTKSSELIDGTLNNLDNPELVQRNLKELVSIGGDTALQNFYNQLTGRAIAKSTTYDERAIQEFLNSKDPIAKRNLAETIKKFRQLKSHKTSSDR